MSSRVPLRIGMGGIGGPQTRSARGSGGNGGEADRHARAIPERQQDSNHLRAASGSGSLPGRRSAILVDGAAAGSLARPTIPLQDPGEGGYF